MKHVTWNDIVKLGTMNPIVQKNLDELGEMPGITHAYALMAMVDELDGRCARLEQDALRYQYLRCPQVKPRSLDVVDDEMAVVDGPELDQAIDKAIGDETAKLGLPVVLDESVPRGEIRITDARGAVLATLRGAGFTDTAETLSTLLDDIAQGKVCT